MTARQTAMEIDYWNCDLCGALFVRNWRTRSQGKRFCSEQCYVTSERKPSSEVTYRHCALCGKLMVVKPWAKKFHKTCGRSCWRILNERNSSLVAYVDCGVCGRLFVSRPMQQAKRKQFCSNSCWHKSERAGPSKERSRLKAIESKVRHLKRCHSCDTTFVTTDIRRSLCSSECRLSLAQYRYAQAREQLDNNLESSPWATPTIVDYLAGRDGGKCHICGKKVDFNADRQRHRKAATIDHIVPFSVSHDSSLENLALAHRFCNLSKNARAANDQLRLFG